MSAEPYVPDDLEFVVTYVSAPDGSTPNENPQRAAEARRGIAKIKADALRGWAGLVQCELAASAAHGIDLGKKCLHGAHSMLMQAGEYADRIEEEA